MSTTYVIEHLQEHKLAPDFLSKELNARFPGKLQLFAITTAWIDAKRGCIPLRIEKSGAFFYEGRRLGPVPQIAELLTVFKVQKIDRGGWYPMKGRVYSMRIKIQSGQKARTLWKCCLMIGPKTSHT